MANEKREIEYVSNPDAIERFPNGSRIVTAIGYTAKADTRYEVYLPIVKTDEEAQERYNCDMDYIIAAGIRQLATRVDYKTVGFYGPDDPEVKAGTIAEGTLKPDGHNAMQAQADDYRVGQKREAGPSAKAAKAKLSAIDEQARAMGFASMDELIADAKRRKGIA